MIAVGLGAAGLPRNLWLLSLLCVWLQPGAFVSLCSCAYMKPRFLLCFWHGVGEGAGVLTGTALYGCNYNGASE